MELEVELEVELEKARMVLPEQRWIYHVPFHRFLDHQNSFDLTQRYDSRLAAAVEVVVVAAAAAAWFILMISLEGRCQEE